MKTSPLSHLRPAALEHFYFGSCYYPEHWSPEQRVRDASRMKAAGWNCVRMAEFAWDLIEPADGIFDFSLFDEAISELGRKGISTILGTPTAAPPRWLSKRHPEILRVDAEGVVMTHGSRQHASHASDVFRSHCRRIVRAMAEHYRDHPHVVGWQIDNEFHCHFSEDHSEAARKAFVEYLRNRYMDDIGTLNRSWGTSFWAQTYDTFDDISTCRRGKPTYVNPAHELEYSRFLSDLVTHFQGEQVDILREMNQCWFISHNGCFKHIDYRGEFGRDLDFLGYDSYPMFENDPEKRPANHAFNLDRARSWTGNFIVLEQQAGPGGQAPYFHDHPVPGEMRRLALTSIARGADGLLFFRWRTCPFGAEEYWCGILDHDDLPRRRYHEAARLGAEMARIGPQVLGTHVHIEAAVASSDADINAADASYAMGLPSADSIAEKVHSWLYRQGIAVGCVHPADVLDGLKLYIIPHWVIFKREWVEPLEAFVQKGGVLVVGARTGTRDQLNNVVAETPPGLLRGLVGASVEEYGRHNLPECRPLMLKASHGAVPTTLWYESLRADPQTEVLATWQGGHLSGTAAVTRRLHGAGQVIYVGTYFTTEVCQWLLPGLVVETGLKPLLKALPAGVEVVCRKANGRKLWFLLNTNDFSVELGDLPTGSILTDQPPETPLRILEQQGVLVIHHQQG
ncbi:MAG: beta-galactosidase [Candidatus Methylacidiphilales bacterium]